MDIVLEAKGLGKSVRSGGSEKSILRDVDFAVGAGEFLAVMGPSGSGKSTLLYNASGMDRPSSGSVRFEGRDLAALPERELSAIRLARMGFVFQRGNLLRNLDLFDNVVLPAYRARKEGRKAVDARAAALMRRMGIEEVARNGIAEVSGGQLQRAAICRALVNSPAILFCDEPTGALDSAAAAEALDILASVNGEGTTILVATHDAAVAARAERALYVLDGRIAGELRLGKAGGGGPDEARGREDLVLAWLREARN